MSVRVDELIDKFGFEVIVYGNSAIEISSTELNRPGLQFAGYFEYFAYQRIQIVGKSEYTYFGNMDKETRRKTLDKFFSYEIPALIVSRDLEVNEDVLEF